MILGHPALRLLARRKFVGTVRKQLRRMRSIQGFLFALIGFSAISLWMGGALFNTFLVRSRAAPPIVDESRLRFAATWILLLAVPGALSFRGLYLPREEIELLFAAPLSREDTIRYRLWNALGKSLLGATFLGVVATRFVASPLYGFVGAFVLTMTVPIFAQMVSLFAGDAENRWIGRVPRSALRSFNLICVFGLIAVLLYPRGGSEAGLDQTAIERLVVGVVDHPVADLVTRIVWPWAKLATATSAAQFLGFLGLCLALWVLAFEACARLRVDFRELSLETSADVARRLTRLRRGATGAAGSRASVGAQGWRVPWLFGRGAFGALAWRKTGAILRKARGTLFVSGAVVVGLILLTRLIFQGSSKQDALAAGGFIGVFGTAYLCAGLRFDFREDLDRMDVVRSWPLAPWRVFFATLLPEVALVVVFLAAAIVARTLIAGMFPPETVAMLALLGPTVLAWVSIDNVVFLLWPQRMTPGTEGVLQQAGRGMLLMLLRMVLVLVAAGAVMGTGWLVYLLSESLALATLVAVLVTLAESALILFLGGRALARFDVARDR